jgi:tetratricopeptide (TPR) repeat protein
MSDGEEMYDAYRESVEKLKKSIDLKSDETSLAHYSYGLSWLSYDSRLNVKEREDNAKNANIYATRAMDLAENKSWTASYLCVVLHNTLSFHENPVAMLERAVALYEEIILTGPDVTVPYKIEYGGALLDLADFHESKDALNLVNKAKTVLSEVLKTNPEDPSILWYLGKAEYIIGGTFIGIESANHYSKASSYFEQCVDKSRCGVYLKSKAIQESLLCRYLAFGHTQDLMDAEINLEKLGGQSNGNKLVQLTKVKTLLGELEAARELLKMALEGRWILELEVQHDPILSRLI